MQVTQSASLPLCTIPNRALHVSKIHGVPTVALDAMINAPYPHPTWLYSFSPFPKDPTQLRFSTFTFFHWPLPNSSSEPIVLNTYLVCHRYLRLTTSKTDFTITPMSLFQWEILSSKLDHSIFFESSNPLNLIKSVYYLGYISFFFVPAPSTMSTSTVWAKPLPLTYTLRPF